MPRKTKEQSELESLETPKAKSKTITKTATKKNDITKEASTKKVAPKKTSARKEETKEKETTSSKTTAKATSKKAVDAKKPVAKKTSTTKKSTTKKSVVTKTKASTTKKSTTKKATATKKKVEIVEYYDLPYRYNQTVVKVLAQTPTNLFIYWDISDEDRENFKKQYGENFFETTRPVLIVYNDTLHYSFEVAINDFANSWYLNIADSKCEYRIELGRRPIEKSETLTTDYVYVSTSNEIESPNDRILFDITQKVVSFRNIKTGVQTQKPITTLASIRNIGKIYNIYDFYRTIYHEENIEDIYGLTNPSSGSKGERI